MNLIPLLLASSFVYNAEAGSPYTDELNVQGYFLDWDKGDLYGNVSDVALLGAASGVAVPIYRDGPSPERHDVIITVGEPGSGEDSADKENAESTSNATARFQLNLHSSTIVVNEAFAKEHSLDISVTNQRLIPVPDDYGVGGQIKTVFIPALSLSDDAGENHLVLKNVTAFVAGSKTKNLDLGIKKQYLAEMSIGLGALDRHGISYAYLPSQGIFKFVPNAAGAELLSTVSGKSLKYKSTGWEIGRLGQWTFSGKNERILPATTALLPFSIDSNAEVTDGQERYALLLLDSYSIIDSYLPGRVNSTTKAKGKHYDHLNLSVGTGETTSLGSVYAQRTITNDVSAPYPEASIGLSNFDVAIDPATQSIAIAASSKSVYKDIRYLNLEEAESKLKKAVSALNEAQENTEPAAQENTEPAAQENSESAAQENSESAAQTVLAVAETNAIIRALIDLNRFEQTLPYFEQLINDKEEQSDCALWQRYGNVQVQLGDYAGALNSFQQASELYHSWWDIDLHQRMDINNRQADAMKRDRRNKYNSIGLMVDELKAKSAGQPVNSVADGWYISQPGECYTADGLVASIHFINGELMKTEEVYRNKLDLDDKLAAVFGNAALSSGNTVLANEAYRQAIKLEDGNTPENRVGLGLVYADQGKWGQADQLFREAFAIEHVRTAIVNGSNNALYNALTVQVWADQLRSIKGSETVITSLKELSAAHPGNVIFKLALIREHKLGSGAETELQSAQERLATLQAEETANKKRRRRNKVNIDSEEINALNERINELLALSTNRQEQIVTLVKEIRAELDDTPQSELCEPWLLAYSGRTEDAVALINKIEESSEDNALYLKATPLWNVVKANALALNGDNEGATKALNRAAALSPFNPVYGLLLAQ